MRPAGGTGQGSAVALHWGVVSPVRAHTYLGEVAVVAIREQLVPVAHAKH